MNREKSNSRDSKTFTDIWQQFEAMRLKEQRGLGVEESYDEMDFSIIAFNVDRERKKYYTKRKKVKVEQNFSDVEDSENQRGGVRSFSRRC